jgi:tetratricopeptide (TPR) repeat protein
VDTSLILAQPEQGRFAILETIREYAAEKLLQAGEAERVRERHVAYYLAYAETQEPRQWGREQVASLDAVDREHDNLRAAAGWALEHGAQELQLRLGAALGRFWQQHHHVQEGADYLLAVLAAPTEAHVLLRARCTFWAGEFLWRCGQEAEGLAHLAHARKLYQSIQHLGGVAEVLQRLGTIAIYQGDLATAEALCTETIALARQVGHPYALSASLNGLGEIARLRGDFASAQPYYEETLRLAEESGTLRVVGIALLNLGLIARPLGNYAAGRAYLLRANTIFGELGEKPNQPYVLEGLADLEAAEGRPERAVSLYAAVENLCATTRISLYGDDQRQHEQAVQTLRQQLTPKRFAAAWQAGLRLTLAQAIQLAPKPDA